MCLDCMVDKMQGRYVLNHHMDKLIVANFVGSCLTAIVFIGNFPSYGKGVGHHKSRPVIPTNQLHDIEHDMKHWQR